MYVRLRTYVLDSTCIAFSNCQVVTFFLKRHTIFSLLWLETNYPHSLPDYDQFHSQATTTIYLRFRFIDISVQQQQQQQHCLMYKTWFTKDFSRSILLNRVTFVSRLHTARLCAVPPSFPPLVLYYVHKYHF